MIKWPEPALINEIRYSGIAVNKMVTENLYTEAQLKQAVCDALTLAATECKALDNDENSADFRESANWCGERIRALIKEIPE